MPSISLNVTYNVALSVPISVSALRQRYLFGSNQLVVNGQYLGDDVIMQYIREATTSLENDLSIKIARQNVQSKVDWYRPDWNVWGSIRVEYPVFYPLGIDGFFGTVRQISYPKEWVSVPATPSNVGSRMIHIVPNGNSAPFISNALTYSGVGPLLGGSGQSYIPNYWTLSYISGWDHIPNDLLSAIGMMAAIPILGVLSDNVIGPGINSKSLSIDGLSQSLSTAGGYKQRIDQYTQQLEKTLMPQLRNTYKGISMVVC